jgi:hypothetical protein
MPADRNLGVDTPAERAGVSLCLQMFCLPAVKMGVRGRIVRGLSKKAWSSFVYSTCTQRVLMSGIEGYSGVFRGTVKGVKTRVVMRDSVINQQVPGRDSLDFQTDYAGSIPVIPSTWFRGSAHLIRTE